MRLTSLLIALLTTSACAAPSSPVTPSEGPWRFSGTVSAMQGGRVSGPIAGAQLSVVSGVNLNARVTTDVSGHYLFPTLSSGRFIVTISAPGYEAVTPVVDLYQDTEVDFALRVH
jgi:hypothetical protein